MSEPITRDLAIRVAHASAAAAFASVEGCKGRDRPQWYSMRPAVNGTLGGHLEAMASALDVWPDMTPEALFRTISERARIGMEVFEETLGTRIACAVFMATYLPIASEARRLKREAEQAAREAARPVVPLGRKDSIFAVENIWDLEGE